MYGIAPQTPAAVVSSSPLPGVTGDDFGSGWRALVNPDNPLFWAGVLVLVTVGAASVAGSARLGPIRVSAGAGKG
jgi:hypothetical protein